MSEKEIGYKARVGELLKHASLTGSEAQELLFAASIPLDDIPPDLRTPLQEWLIAQQGDEAVEAIISWRRVCELLERREAKMEARYADRAAMLRKAPCSLIQRAEGFLNSLEGREMPDVLPDDFEDTLAYKRHNYTNYDDILYECFIADEGIYCGSLWEDKEAERWCCKLNGAEAGNIEIMSCPVNEEAYMILKRAANHLVGELDSAWRERHRARKGH